MYFENQNIQTSALLSTGGCRAHVGLGAIQYLFLGKQLLLLYMKVGEVQEPS